MEFTVSGQRFDIDEQSVISAVRGVRPEYTDSRHKYFVEIEGQPYPIKQVLSLAIGLPNRMFTAQYAERILTKVGFLLGEYDSSPPRRQRTVREAGLAEKYRASSEDATMIRFAVSLEFDEDGYVTASCPALIGCHSQGRSRTEAIKNIHEAIRGYLASMTNHGETIPDIDWEVVEVAA